MIVAFAVHPDKRKLIPATVHVDGTVRPQTVSKTVNPLFYQLIETLGKHTGHPVVLNTSFNVRGEPIICTPLEAVRCYFSTGMDVLAIGDFLLQKRDAAFARHVGARVTMARGTPAAPRAAGAAAK